MAFKSALTYAFLCSPIVALFALSQAAFYYAFKYIISSMDPLKTKKKDAHEKSAKVLDRLGVRMIACVLFYRDLQFSSLAASFVKMLICCILLHHLNIAQGYQVERI